MSRYTYIHGTTGLAFCKPRVYRLVYTLESLGYLEFYLGKSLSEIDGIETTNRNLTIMLYCALLDTEGTDFPISKAEGLVKNLGKEKTYKAFMKAFENAFPVKNHQPTTSPEEMLSNPDVSSSGVLLDHWDNWLILCGDIALDPQIAYKYTPKELFYRAEGAKKAHKRTYELAAWHSSHILNMFSKKRITPKQLLGDEQQETIWSDKAFDELWEKRQQRKKDLEDSTCNDVQ